MTLRELEKLIEPINEPFEQVISKPIDGGPAKNYQDS